MMSDLGEYPFLALGGITGLIVLLGYWLFRFLIHNASEKEVSEITFKDYIKDHFFGLDWQWGYYLGDEVINIRSLCPTCRFEIIPKNEIYYADVSRVEFLCEECGDLDLTFDCDYSEVKKKVEVKIQNNLRLNAMSGVRFPS